MFILHWDLGLLFWVFGTWVFSGTVNLQGGLWVLGANSDDGIVLDSIMRYGNRSSV